MFNYKTESTVKKILNEDFFSTDLFTTAFTTGVIFPRTNIRMTLLGYLVEMEIPGYNKENISIDFDNDILTVSGVRSKVEENEGDIFKIKEINDKSFERKFKIKNVNEKGITAEYSNGILKINLLYLKENEKPRNKIEIK